VTDGRTGRSGEWDALELYALLLASLGGGADDGTGSVGALVDERVSLLVDEAVKVWSRPGFDTFLSVPALRFTPFDYQLQAARSALRRMRGRAILADEVGLGKTIEAGLVALELLLRHRAKRVMIVCPPGLMVKWQDEMAEKFGLDFVIVDSAQLNALRRSHGSAANPFRVYPLTIVSLSWLRGAKAERLLHEVLDPDSGRRAFDLLTLDEAHHVAPAARSS
jgi:SNF2 family DNA or RNA helicase